MGDFSHWEVLYLFSQQKLKVERGSHLEIIVGLTISKIFIIRAVLSKMQAASINMIF